VFSNLYLFDVKLDVKTYKLVPVTYPLLQSTLRNLINCIGKNSKQFYTHSFRRGGASWAFSSEIPSELIQLYGDWKSDVITLFKI